MRLRSLPCLVLALLLASAGAARAEGGEPTVLALAVPADAQLGQTVEVQARLTDAAGIPIPKATVLFTAPLAFLSAESDVVLADARTDAQGIATARFEARSEGRLVIRAAFRGDERYAATAAERELAVGGDAQLYAQHVGVLLPGLNTGPVAFPMLRDGTPTVGLIEGSSRLWPLLSGWPIALALMIIWSFYASVVVMLFRIVAAAKEAESA